MSALLLAMLQDSSLAPMSAAGLGGESTSGNALLQGLGAASGSIELTITFRHLLLASAAISMLGLCAALALPDKILRGREDKAL